MGKFQQFNLAAILAVTIASSSVAPTYAQQMVVGVNVVNPMRASVGALTEAGAQAIAPEGQEKKPDLAASMRVRVGVPLVARGPAPNIADNWFTEIQLPGGKFRGFTAGATTFAIDGNQPYDMDM
jgi:hypothetical protein